LKNKQRGCDASQNRKDHKSTMNVRRKHDATPLHPLLRGYFKLQFNVVPARSNTLKKCRLYCQKGDRRGRAARYNTGLGRDGDVAVGSKADIAMRQPDVCFTPKSGHCIAMAHASVT
jgi:hypothetical protein